MSAFATVYRRNNYCVFMTLFNEFVVQSPIIPMGKTAETPPHIDARGFTLRRSGALALRAKSRFALNYRPLDRVPCASRDLFAKSLPDQCHEQWSARVWNVDGEGL